MADRNVGTHLLLDGSPAIDRGSNPDNLDFEQRGPGFPRVVGVAANIGATEGNAQRLATAVPVLGPWALAALSALVGGLGWRRRRRSG
ncbi:MAG: IPTL-CTERM sorting domain-containing protein [Aromatoleum sp.]|nr:IPTL-CTERM sorting domain-containing protein [Aromatoleum sp.]